MCSQHISKCLKHISKYQIEGKEGGTTKTDTLHEENVFVKKKRDKGRFLCVKTKGWMAKVVWYRFRSVSLKSWSGQKKK